MKFIDETEIHVTAGNGGSGMTSYRRARNRPKLGPDGGNGGPGGDVVLRATSSLSTLSTLRYRQVYRAVHGGKGAANDKTGRSGDDKIIPVPCGTVVRDRESGEVLGELIEDGSVLVVAQGGKRGYGNAHFTSATNRCPHYSTPGTKGENRTVRLTLKLLADVGLAGFPNAGKSTLLSRVSAARPRIADYPFTTLVPNLGVVDLEDGGKHVSSFVMADVPGLIEGAAEGRGLGHDFLKHLERTRLIVYVIDAFDFERRSPAEAYSMLRKELSGYSQLLAEKKSVVILTKMDLEDADPERRSSLEEAKKFFAGQSIAVCEISSVSGQGIHQLKYDLGELLAEADREEAEAGSDDEEAPVHVIAPEQIPAEEGPVSG